MESTSGSFRDECLNCHWLESPTDAELKIESWRDDYNKSRPHWALNNLPPLQFVASIENRTVQLILRVVLIMGEDLP